MRLAALLAGPLALAAPLGLAIAVPARAEVRIVPPRVDPALAAVAAGPQRSDANRARDRYRHPLETLGFFGLAPTMTVVEVTPGGGWYTEILAPYLRDRGRLLAAGSWPGTAGGAKSVATFKARLDADPASFGKVEVTAFGKDHYEIAPPGSADLVLTIREIHNYMTDGFAPAAFAAFYAALKPGGILGVVEHRLPENAPAAREATSGYVKVSTVRKLAEAAGFRFVAESAINWNPKDSHDYPKGVWTLPPTYDDGDHDRARYAAIGESDRMTLKFVKP